MSLRYLPAADLGVVTAYFNPCGYATKLANFERFAQPILEAGIPLAIAEATFAGAPALDRRYDSLLASGGDVMWQKERLLNLASAALPARCTKVAWLDADVLFEREDWAQATSALLERQVVAQPFSEAVRLPRGQEAYAGQGEVYAGFAAVCTKEPQILMRGDFARHGHTGFAWAARREVLAKHGLYDACIAGSGDHMMAHAFAGDWDSACIGRIIGRNNPHLAYFRAWSERLYGDVRAKVGHVEGRLLHLWHGEMANRRYVLRNQELAAHGFDPARDLRVGPGGLWEWASAKPELHAWAKAYFAQRREDEGQVERPEATAPGREVA